jgi:hypothetical protein
MAHSYQYRQYHITINKVEVEVVISYGMTMMMATKIIRLQTVSLDAQLHSSWLPFS